MREKTCRPYGTPLKFPTSPGCGSMTGHNQDHPTRSRVLRPEPQAPMRIAGISFTSRKIKNPDVLAQMSGRVKDFFFCGRAEGRRNQRRYGPVLPITIVRLSDWPRRQVVDCPTQCMGLPNSSIRGSTPKVCMTESRQGCRGGLGRGC